MTMEEWFMWLKILISVLPVLPDLITSTEEEIAKMQSDTTWQAKAQDALKALDNIGATVGQLITKL